MNPYEIKYRNLKDAIVKRANELEASNRNLTQSLLINSEWRDPLRERLERTKNENRRVIGELWEILQENTNT